jgi:hypothetical protein
VAAAACFSCAVRRSLAAVATASPTVVRAVCKQ